MFIHFYGISYIKIDNNKRINNHTVDDVLEFIKNHPENSSVYAIYNNNEFINFNSSAKMPIASTVKIIIAIEYANQVSNGILDPDEIINIRTLNLFFLKDSDGMSHQKWLDHLHINNLIKNETVCLEEIVRGMIHFSSNANTEYLIGKLKLESINHMINTLDLEKHDFLFPISSAWLIPSFLEIKKGISRKDINRVIQNMDIDIYKEYAGIIHEKLEKGLAADLIKHWDLNFKKNQKSQEYASNKLPSSTTKEYTKLMNYIHHGNLMSKDITSILKNIMNRPLNTHSHYKELAFKGGSTNTVLTQALYCTDQFDNQIEISVFIHDESRIHHIWLSKKLDLFLERFLTDSLFREKVANQLNHYDRKIIT